MPIEDTYVLIFVMLDYIHRKYPSKCCQKGTISNIHLLETESVKTADTKNCCKFKFHGALPCQSAIVYFISRKRRAPLERKVTLYTYTVVSHIEISVW